MSHQRARRSIAHNDSGCWRWAFALGVLLWAQSTIGAEPQSMPPVPAPAELFDRNLARERHPRRQTSDHRAEPACTTGGAWTSQGPGPALFGQTENIQVLGLTVDPVVGAIHAVVAHPTDVNTLFIGSVNGGIWRTTNATDPLPTWTPLIDFQRTLSIGALKMDPTNSSVLLAGIGRRSSFSGTGGPSIGLLLTTDGGNNWTLLNDPLLATENFSSVYIRGLLLMAAARDNTGLLRSTDGGATWSRVSAQGTGLPGGAIFDLVVDPTNSQRFYCTVGSTGVFLSVNGGANWSNVSQNDATLNTTISSGSNNNAELAVSPTTGRVYVGVILNGQASYIGFSDNQGGAWTAMDIPQITTAGGNFTLNPTQHPGSQGGTHFSIRVDPATATTVYIGGDRQPHQNEGTGNPTLWPNFIGAQDFSGNLWRGDTTVAPNGAVPSPQWEHLTHSDSVAAIPGGGTANSSAPHADSRDMVFSPNGDLIEVDDGGIYRRTSPADNTGDWFALVGDLRVTEIHDIAWDAHSDILIAGDQDTGSPEQSSTGSAVWRSVSTADGGDVDVDDFSGGDSIRYSSNQSLGSFRRRSCDASNSCGASTFIGLNVTTGSPLGKQFVTPIRLNVTDGTRLIIGGSNGVYESFDRGDNIVQLNTSSINNAMIYGHASNADLIVVGSGGNVLVRTTAAGALASPGAFPGGTVTDVAIDPANANNLYATDGAAVYASTDQGASWNDISGNLPATGAGQFNTLAFIPDSGHGARLALGTDLGVFARLLGDGMECWCELGGSGPMPNALVWDLEYDAADNVLAAGTMGRGAWTLGDASNVAITDTAPPEITCPGNQTVECDESTDPAATGVATATDECDSDPEITHSDAITPGDCPAERTITRTWTATDVSSNSASCEQTIEVVDTTPPTITSCGLASGDVDGACEFLAPFSATATDNCGIDADDVEFTFVVTTTNALAEVQGTITREQLSATSVRVSGILRVHSLTSCPAVVQMTVSVDDECGNPAADCTSNGTYRDLIPPVITCPEDLELLRGPNVDCPMTVQEWLDSATATDNCDPDVTITNNSEEVGAACCSFPCDGDNFVTFVATDDCGNTDDCVANLYSDPNHPGWNDVDVQIPLTSNQPTYWSALTGNPRGVLPFDSLDPGCLKGRIDVECSGDRVMRGYIVAWAVNNVGQEIRWNHLSGEATVVNYSEGSAWTYLPYGFQALAGQTDGAVTGTPGTLNLDGAEFEPAYDLLLLDFYAVQTSLGTGLPFPPRGFDLTLLPVSADLRQESAGPVTTKATFTIWNQNETKFTGTDRCITHWDERIVRQYEDPNHMLATNLQTAKGKAQIDGLASNLCNVDFDTHDGRPLGQDTRDRVSTAAALLGLSAQVIEFEAINRIEVAGTNLHGAGSQPAIIKADILGAPPPELRPDVVGGELPTSRSGLPGNKDGLFSDAVGQPTVAAARVSASAKGSILVYPKVELRWDVNGNVLQDTFISLFNDYPASVLVQMYFVNGDPPLP